MLQCQPLLKQLERLHMLPESLFQWEYSGPRILCIPAPEPQGSTSSLPWCFLLETPGWAILPGCGVEHVFNILP